jgi:hypothetical protein
MNSQLSFSVGKLLIGGIVLLAVALAIAGFGYELKPGEHISRLGFLLLLFGPNGARYFLIGAGILTFYAGAAALRRAAGNGIAAAIRHDGIELNGLFMSRTIPWTALDRLYLRTYSSRGTTYTYVKAEARRPAGANPIHHALAAMSYGVSTSLLQASGQQVIAWIEQANAARNQALATSPRPIAPLPTSGFGRRGLG